MLIGNVYGRLARDPEERTTKAGNPMVIASMAVDAAGKDAEPNTLWVSILAFGAASEALLRASKGQMVSAMGRLTRGSYIAKDGTERESWTLLADSVVTAKSASPSGGKRKEQGQDSGQDRKRNEASQRAQDPRLFDDDIPF